MEIHNTQKDQKVSVQPKVQDPQEAKIAFISKRILPIIALATLLGGGAVALGLASELVAALALIPGVGYIIGNQLPIEQLKAKLYNKAWNVATDKGKDWTRVFLENQGRQVVRSLGIEDPKKVTDLEEKVVANIREAIDNAPEILKKGADALEDSITAWTLEPLGSGAQFVNISEEASGAEIATRLVGALLGGVVGGGLGVNLATEVAAKSLPRSVKDSKVSKTIEKVIPEVRKPLQKASEAIDSTVQASDEVKETVLQIGTAIGYTALTGGGFVSLFGEEAFIGTVGAVGQKLGLVDKKHFEGQKPVDGSTTKRLAAKAAYAVGTTAAAEVTRATLGSGPALAAYTLASVAATPKVRDMITSTETYQTVEQAVKDFVFGTASTVTPGIVEEAKTDAATTAQVTQEVKQEPAAVEEPTTKTDPQPTQGPEEKPSFMRSLWNWVTEVPEGLDEEDLWL